MFSRLSQMSFFSLFLLTCLLSSGWANPDVGKPAPDFTLMDQNGQKHTLSQYKGKVVVLEWTNPTCPFVVRHYKQKTMTNLAKKHGDVVWLTLNSSYFANDKENGKWAKIEGVKTVLNDPSGKVGKAYGARTTPHMYVVDQKGNLAYKGAIDDDPYGDKKAPMNYIDQAVSSLKAGKTVAMSDTKPYGCSVKYKN